jgi:hypothetical protein
VVPLPLASRELAGVLVAEVDGRPAVPLVAGPELEQGPTLDNQCIALITIYFWYRSSGDSLYESICVYVYPRPASGRPFTLSFASFAVRPYA